MFYTVISLCILSTKLLTCLELENYIGFRKRTAAVCRHISVTVGCWCRWHLYVKPGGLEKESAAASPFLWSYWGTMVCLPPFLKDKHVECAKLPLHSEAWLLRPLTATRSHGQAPHCSLLWVPSQKQQTGEASGSAALLSPPHQDNEVSIRVSGKWMMAPAIDPWTAWEQYYNNPYQSAWPFTELAFTLSGRKAGAQSKGVRMSER